MAARSPCRLPSSSTRWRSTTSPTRGPPGSAGVGGTQSDIAIQAELFAKLKREVNELQAQHSGQPVEQIERDSDRDRWFTADEAKDYGFVDNVVARAAQVPSKGAVS